METTDQLQAIEQRLAVIQQRMDDLIELNELLDKVKPRVSRTTLAAVEALVGAIERWQGMTEMPIRDAIKEIQAAADDIIHRAAELRKALKGQDDA